MSNYYFVTDQHQDELYHYGVLGMKWGVRRANRATRRAASSYSSSQRKFDKAQKSTLSMFGSTRKTLKKAVDASHDGNDAFVNSRKADAINRKHEAKFQKKAAKNAARIELAKGWGVNSKIVSLMQKKADKFLKAHDDLQSRKLSSLTDQIEKGNAKIYTYIDQLDKRAQWEARVGY